MPKKREIDIKKWLWIAGVPSALGAISFLAVNLTTYINLPKAVAENFENDKRTVNKVDTIEDYIKEQQIIQREQQKMNAYFYEKEREQDEVNEGRYPEPYPIISQDGRWFFDEDRQEWRRIEEMGDDDAR